MIKHTCPKCCGTAYSIVSAMRCAPCDERMEQEKLPPAVEKIVFYPSRPGHTMVERWEWQKSTGLMVFYKHGGHCRSSWTLAELLNADMSRGDGLPIAENIGRVKA
jgi:hypothetical protein